MLNIVILGPQGSGKGTQARLIAAEYGLPHFSPGQLFRSEIEKGSPLGRQVADYVKRGEIVPTALAESVIQERLARPDTERGLILDGFPRLQEQALQLDRIMERLGRKVTHAIKLDITDATAYVRLTGRLECTNKSCATSFHQALRPPAAAGLCDKCLSPLAPRQDDEAGAIRRRLEIYHSETEPLANFYQAKGVLHDINAERPVDEIFAEIKGILGKPVQ